MFKRLLIGLTFLGLSILAQAQVADLQVMTFNLRYDNPADSANNWHQRKADIVSFIQRWNPTILGIQEGLLHQVNYLDSCLTNYNYVGVGRDDGKEAGEFSAIFYDNTKVRLIKDTTFWLSLTPQNPSVGWDAALPRICTAAQFTSINKQDTFWVFNTHYDHIGKTAREWSSRLIIHESTVLNSDYKFPFIIMGDFNSTPDEKPYQDMTGSNIIKDTRLIASQRPTGPNQTFNGFKALTTASPRIDYIFVYHFNTISQANIPAIRENGLWLSDHLPVSATLSFIK